MKRICFIAPYKELAQLAKQVNHELGLHIEIKEGNLEEGIKPAQQAEREGAQVIISRGGTASIIRKNVDIPVVEIKMTGYDILKCLYPYRNTKAIVGIVGYQNVVYGCRTISEVLNIPIKEVIIPNVSEGIDWAKVQHQVTDLINHQGVEKLIGDTTVMSKLESIDMAADLITSGKESIIQAIDEAWDIMEIRETEKEKSKRFRAVLDFVHDAVIATDEAGLVTVINPGAEKIFNVKSEQVLGKFIKQVIPNTGITQVLNTGEAVINDLQEVAMGHILTNRIPIIVDDQIKGVVATFQEISQIQGAEQKIRQNLYAKGLVTRYSFKDILTHNPRMDRMIDIAKDFAKTDATVLIEGESGTGKEMLAQSIHSASPRKDGPFVAVNCAALPPQLLESELFGYVEGAFTGAKKGGKIGLFELAHNGTIFLDEIGEMDKGLQARLLRVLEEKQVMRLGSDKVIPVNIRVLAATNANLKKQINQDQFRMDLYYRLNVLKLQTIPLRERKEDIKYLAYHFMRKINQQYGRQMDNFSSEVINLLTNYSWPGNIRELRNIIERIVLATKTDNVTLKDIEFIVEELHSSIYFTENASTKQLDHFLEGSMQQIKQKIIIKVLEEEGYNKSRTAKRLGIDRSTIERYLQ